MIELVKPQHQICVSFTEPNFWPNIVRSKELESALKFVIPRLSEMQDIYWVVGKRGSGKSQVLEIIARMCMEEYRNWKVFPILIKIKGLEDDSPSTVYKTLCMNIATSLVYWEDKFNDGLKAVGLKPDEMGASSRLKKLSEYQDRFDSSNFSDTEKLRELLRIIRGKNLSYVLLIDELDKIDPIPFFDFLIHNQTLFSDLVEMKAKMFISMQSEVYKMMQEKEGEEADFFRGEAFYPPAIKTPSQCKQLIDSRINMKKPKWHSPFDMPSYSIILKKSEGIPRKILRTAGKIIEVAYKENLPNIPHEFVIKFFEKGKELDEFSNYIDDILYEINPLSRKIIELRNRDYASILNVFKLKPVVANRADKNKADFITLQTLGLNIDKSKYRILIEEMKTKQLLLDRGINIVIERELDKFLSDIKDKWDKNSIDVYKKLLKTDIKVEVEEKKIKKEIKTPSGPKDNKIDSAILDILEKYPFSTMDDIKKQLKNYTRGSELTNWRKIINARMKGLENQNRVIKIEGKEELYVNRLDNITKEFASGVGNKKLLRDLVMIYTLGDSRDEDDQKIFLKEINKVIISEIGVITNSELDEKNTEQIVNKIDRMGNKKLLKYFNLYLTAQDLGDLDIVIDSSQKLLLEIAKIEMDKEKFEVEKEKMFSFLRKHLEEIDIKNFAIGINLPEHKKIINHILRYHSGYVPYAKDISDLKVNGLEKGFIYECSCGLEVFSVSKSELYHLNCTKRDDDLKLTGKVAYRFINKKDTAIFICSLIQEILHDVFPNSELNHSVFVSKSGFFNYVIKANSKLVSITNESEYKKFSKKPYIYVINLDFDDKKKINVDRLTVELSQIKEIL